MKPRGFNPICLFHNDDATRRVSYGLEKRDYTRSSLSAMYFVYGLYTALFISYVRILRDRRTRNQAKTLYFWPTVILFFLETMVVAGETIYRSLTFYITFNAVKTKECRPLIHYLQRSPRQTAG
ncbi:hypothetical protein MPER_07123, partial [Moniliophthora perniciosa FA553]